MQNGCATMADSLAKILSAIMAKPLQLQYSGKGRVVKGKGKLNFSLTRVFRAMSGNCHDYLYLSFHFWTEVEPNNLKYNLFHMTSNTI